MSLQPSGPRHWHITRDIKPKGECAACDLAWKAMEESGYLPEAGVDSSHGR